MPKEIQSRFEILNLKKERQIGNKWHIGESTDISTSKIKVCSVDYSRMRSEKHELHHHPKTAEIYIVLAGEIFIQIEHETRKLIKNDLLCIHPAVSHRIMKYSPNAEVLIIQDNPDPNDKIIVL